MPQVQETNHIKNNNNSTGPVAVGNMCFRKIKQVAGKEGTWAEGLRERTFGLKHGEERKAFQTQGTTAKSSPMGMRQEQVRVRERKRGWASRAIDPARQHQLTQVSPDLRRCGVRGCQLDLSRPEFPPLGNGSDDSHSNDNKADISER